MAETMPQGTTFGIKSGETYPAVALIENLKMPEQTSEAGKFVSHDNLVTRYMETGVVETSEGELTLAWDMDTDLFQPAIGSTLDVQITFPSADKATFSMIVTKWAMSEAAVDSTDPIKVTVGFQPKSAPVWS